MEQLRERLDKTQQHFAGAAKAVGGAIRQFTINPHEAAGQIGKVSEDSTAALLADPDSAIALIAEKAQDDGHAAHALSVMTLALLTGKQAQLPEQALRALGIGALLHDIGKTAINPSILRNSERNRHEEAIYQNHCRAGHDLAARADNLAKPTLDVILSHHERVDGSGFPDRLAGNAIPLAARLVAIANRFDNLVNPIDYRHALSPSEALSTLWTREKKSFDATLLQLFVRAMGVYPPGSIVQLGDGRVGLILDADALVRVNGIGSARGARTDDSERGGAAC
jgi:HD-GYP domain-containing protein (c-di-GMP phosphodiesterase class II)